MQRASANFDMVGMIGDDVFAWNLEDAYSDYAARVGHEPLTTLEKQQAILNHVIDVAGKAKS